MIRTLHQTSITSIKQEPHYLTCSKQLAHIKCTCTFLTVCNIRRTTAGTFLFVHRQGAEELDMGKVCFYLLQKSRPGRGGGVRKQKRPGNEAGQSHLSTLKVTNSYSQNSTATRFDKVIPPPPTRPRSQYHLVGIHFLPKISFTITWHPHPHLENTLPAANRITFVNVNL
jgi:hypothetical protein